MTLSQKDYYEYLNTHLNLLFFVGSYTGILNKNMEFGEFLKTNFQTKGLCRDAFLKEKEELLDEYIGDGTEIPEEQLLILDGFRNSIIGRLVLLKCLSKHAIFKSIEDGKFYAVKALSDSFDELIPDYPAVFELSILPFKGQIIYDGFIKGGNVKIGTNMKKSLHQEYMQAKKNNEIITSLDE